MSELRSTIDSLKTETLSESPDARIEEDFSELHRAVELLEVERLRRLAEIDRRGIYERDGHLSAASWLAKTHRVGWGQAREQVRTARALEEMPETRRALEDGEVSLTAAKLLANARDVDPEMFTRSEPELVEAARIHSISDLGRVTTFWRQRVERALPRSRGAPAGAQEVARIGLVPRDVRVDGDLDPETGESLLTALAAVLDSDPTLHETSRDRAGPPLRFPGCDRPHTWCDAHHVLHWADGGPTAASNLLLLCRRHHRLVHRSGGFTLELLDGRPVFRRPDGTVLEDRVPP